MEISDKQLDKIQKIADQKDLEIKEIQYDKYKHLYDIAFRFLRQERVLLYGGLAINDLMPNDLRFYPVKNLPDIDIFTVNSKKLSQRLVAEYKRLGFDVVSVGEALHENTYKIFVEGMQIADVTDISESVYRRLARGKVKSTYGVYIVNPLYLQMSLHAQMSQPFDAHRWMKVYKRLTSFYKAYPPSKCNHSINKEFKVHHPANHIEQTIIKAVKKWVIDNNAMSFGGSELQKILFEGNDHGTLTWEKSTMFDVMVSNDVYESAKQIVATLANKSIGISRVYSGDAVIPQHVFLTYKKKRIIGLYKSDTCKSFVTYQGVNVASFHTMCSMYMSLMFSPYKHHSKKHIQCIINMLGGIQLKIFSNAQHTHKKILNQFVLECYGSYESMATMKRKQIQRRNA